MDAFGGFYRHYVHLTGPWEHHQCLFASSWHLQRPQLQSKDVAAQDQQLQEALQKSTAEATEGLEILKDHRRSLQTAGSAHTSVRARARLPVARARARAGARARNCKCEMERMYV